MKVKTYIDLIFIQNIVINYILLTQTEMLCFLKVNKKRKVISSTVGAIVVILMLMLKIQILNFYITKLLLGFVMVRIMFKEKRIKKLTKQTLLFFVSNIIAIGTMNFVKEILKLKQSTIYIEVIIYVVSVGITKLVINKMWKTYKYRLKSTTLVYQTRIKIKNKTYYYNAFLDTGNSVKKGKYTIVFAEKLKDLTIKKNYEKEELVEEVEVKTISGTQRYSAVRANKIEIFVHNKYIEIKNVAVVFLEDGAFNNREYNMILNNNIFEESLGGIAI